LTIALGATPIGRAGRAPDEDGNINFIIRSKILTSSAIIEHLIIKSTVHSHREGFATSRRK
jgi:hypothetical protein